MSSEGRRLADWRPRRTTVARSATARNALGIFGAGAVRRVVTLAALFLISRTLKQSDFQAYALLLGTAELFRGVLGFSSDQLLVRLLQSTERDTWLAPAILLKVALGIGGALLVWLLAWILGYPASAVHRAWILVPYLAIAGTNESMAAFMQSRRTASVTAISVALAGVGYLTGVILLAKASLGFVAFMAWLIAFEGSILLLQVVLARRALRWQLRWRLESIVELLRAGWPIGLATVLTMTYFRLDVVVLGHFYPDEADRYYSAYKLAESALLIGVAVSGALLPELSRMAHRPHSPTYRLVSASLGGSSAAVLIVQSLMLVFGRDIASMAYGASFGTIAPALVVLLGAATFMAGNMVTAVVIVAYSKQRWLIPLTTFNVAVNLVANLVLIPRFGYAGAAWATLITEALNAAIQVWLVKRILGLWPVRWPGILVGLSSILYASLAFASFRPIVVWTVASGGIALALVLLIRVALTMNVRSLVGDLSG